MTLLMNRNELLITLSRTNMHLPTLKKKEKKRLGSAPVALFPAAWDIMVSLFDYLPILDFVEMKYKVQILKI